MVFEATYLVAVLTAAQMSPSGRSQEIGDEMAVLGQLAILRESQITASSAYSATLPST